ncbi:MAG: hypothetical protein ACJA0F_000053 [Dinoroseobacter sp.]|jgi:hypothetical protein
MIMGFGGGARAQTPVSGGSEDQSAGHIIRMMIKRIVILLAL